MARIAATDRAATVSAAPQTVAIEQLEISRRKLIIQNRAFAKANSCMMSKISALETRISQLVCENLSLRNQSAEQSLAHRQVLDAHVTAIQDALARQFAELNDVCNAVRRAEQLGAYVPSLRLSGGLVDGIGNGDGNGIGNGTGNGNCGSAGVADVADLTAPRASLTAEDTRERMERKRRSSRRKSILIFPGDLPLDHQRERSPNWENPVAELDSAPLSLHTNTPHTPHTPQLEDPEDEAGDSLTPETIEEEDEAEAETEPEAEAENSNPNNSATIPQPAEPLNSPIGSPISSPGIEITEIHPTEPLLPPINTRNVAQRREKRNRRTSRLLPPTPLHIDKENSPSKLFSKLSNPAYPAETPHKPQTNSPLHNSPRKALSERSVNGVQMPTPRKRASVAPKSGSRRAKASPMATEKMPQSLLDLQDSTELDATNGRTRRQSRRRKPVNYKEPSLNTKLRRPTAELGPAVDDDEPELVIVASRKAERRSSECVEIKKERNEDGNEYKSSKSGVTKPEPQSRSFSRSGRSVKSGKPVVYRDDTDEAEMSTKMIRRSSGRRKTRMGAAGKSEEKLEKSEELSDKKGICGSRNSRKRQSTVFDFDFTDDEPTEEALQGLEAARKRRNPRTRRASIM